MGLQGVTETVGIPTVADINDSPDEYAQALQAFGMTLDLGSEDETKAELGRITRSGSLRPLGFVRSIYRRPSSFAPLAPARRVPSENRGR